MGPCLKWVVTQPEWVRKVLVGGLWSLTTLTLIALPVFVGYCVRVVRAGFTESPLPTWDGLADLYGDGLRVMALWFAHWAPVGLAAWAAVRFGLVREDSPELLVFLLVIAGAFAILAWATYVNTALLRVIVLRDSRAAVQFGENAEFVRRNLNNFGRFLVLILAVNWIGQASCLLCGIGIFPGTFWSACTFNYALGQIGRCDIYLPREATP
jgi:Protein of unknown function (DUF4013)